jgi:hypothetical protein
MTGTAPARIWGAATATIGAAMLTQPAAVTRIVTGVDGPGTPNLMIVRVLGGRQVLQGIAVLASPDRSLVTTGGSITDLLHAASMVAAAIVWPRYRRPALVSATIAGASTVAGFLTSRCQ